LLLSWFIPGLGEIALGETAGGMLVLVPFAVLWLVAAFDRSILLVCLIPGFVVWLAGQVRVRRAAVRLAIRREDAARRAAA
jgi:hypothetical protein